MSIDHYPRLLVTDANGTHTHPLVHFPFTLGRSSESNLCMAHAQVSRQHASIESEPDGLYLRDLGSRHGTLRNGERIERVRLRSGDRIALGHSSVALLFLDDAGADEHLSVGPDTITGTRELLQRVSSQVSGSDLEKLSLFLEAAQRFNGTQVIAIPLRRRSTGTMLGLLYLDSRLQSCNLSSVSRDILRAIATEAATLVENARMLEAEKAAALMRKEMEIAASIQQRIIACDLPAVPGFALQARTLPCTEVGGDFYDVICTPDGCVAIVADVSGKGMPAALLASIVQGMMYAQINSGASLVDAVNAVNAFLCARVSGTKYVTLVALRCRRDGSAEFVNGGHIPPLLVNPDGSVHVIEDGDMPVGMLPEAAFHTIHTTIPHGGRVVLLSDGVSEAENAAGEQFTIPMFEQYLADQDPIAAVFSAVDRFSDGIPQADDRTMLTIDRLA
jgi:serine phosphatase RsbU (regulator of sigma subunit)